MLRFNSVGFKYTPESDLVLKEIDLQVRSGERVVIMGGNGSGKTTLALLAAGLLRPTSGTIDREGADSPAGVVFQNPDNQIVSISVEHELAFPLECRQVSPGAMRKDVDAALARFGLSGSRDASPSDLSGGEKQKLALASALISRPGLLILDEPTSHLDMTGRRLLHDAIEDIRSDHPNLATIMVTQSSSEALKCDRLILIKNGCIVADGTPESIFELGDVRTAYGIDIPDSVLAKSVDESRLVATESRPGIKTPAGDKPTDLIATQELFFGWADGTQIFNCLDLGVCQGRITGVAAGSGQGKTTLGYILAGLVEPLGGHVAWQGEKQKPSDLMRKVAYLFQFPERQIFADTVHKEVAFGLRRLGIAEDSVDAGVRSALKAVGLSYSLFANRSPHLLSGGEKRKVALASIIALDRPLIFFDEPTAELDVEAIELLKGTLYKQKDVGKTQIIASHDMDFLFETCDDIVILADGKLVFRGDKYGLLDSREVFTDCGLSVPGLIELCQSDRLLSFIRENRISSIGELVSTLKFIP